MQRVIKVIINNISERTACLKKEEKCLKKTRELKTTLDNKTQHEIYKDTQ